MKSSRKGISQRVLLSWLKTATIIFSHQCFQFTGSFLSLQPGFTDCFQDAKILKVIYIERIEFRQLEEYNS